MNSPQNVPHPLDTFLDQPLNSPLNIVLSAYACRPGMGSEPGVGWNTAVEMAKVAKVVVITRQSNRPFIEPVLQDDESDRLQFIYCDIPKILQFIFKPGVLIHYYLWQISAYLTLKKRLKTNPFQLVHHITYVRYSTPSFLAFLPVPFLWGPVGGGEMAPSAFWQDFGWKARLYEWARLLMHRLGEVDPFTRITAQRSKLVWSTTADTAQRLRSFAPQQLEIFPESALSPQEIADLAQYAKPPQQPLRFISMARLLHWKGLHLGIRGFAAASLPQEAEYWICGEGPERSNLEDLAQRLGVGDRVQFWGRLPRDQSLQRLSECTALVHPSLHDSGGWVCIEAMATGRPVICLDLGGPAVQVTPDTGFKIAAHSPQAAVEGIAQAMETLSQNPDLVVQLGAAGQQRVKDFFSWDFRRKKLLETYHHWTVPRS